jgi:hypothetical protein
LTGKYNGMICAVTNDTTNNGLYICSQNQGVDVDDWSAVGSSITIDDTLSSTSTNPLQNSVIHTQLGLKQNTISTTGSIETGTITGNIFKGKIHAPVKFRTRGNQNYEGFLFQTLPTTTDVTNETYKDAMFLSRSGQLVLGKDLITDTTGSGGGVLTPTAGYILQADGNAYFNGNLDVITTGAGTGTDTSSQLKISDDESSNPQYLKLGVNSTSNYSYIQSTESGVGQSVLTLNPLGGNIGIGTTSPLTRFQIGEMTNYGSFSWDSDAAIVSCETKTSNSVLNDPETALYLTRQGTSSLSYGAMAAFKLSRYENSGTDSRTRFDINLAHGSFDDINVLTALSSGNIGIGTNAPTEKLHIDGGNLKAQLAKIGNLDFGSAGNPALYAGFAENTNFTTNNYAFLQGSGGETFVNAKTGKYVAFRINNSDKMRLLSNGNFGIGNTSPAYTLDVTGNINFTGNLTKNGSAYSTGASLPAISGTGGTTSSKYLRINADGTGAEWAFTGVPNSLLSISSSDSGKVLKVDSDGDATFSNPTKANWNETTTTSAAYIENKPTIFSGSYDDLSNKPSATGLGDCLSSAHLQVSTTTQDLFDGIEIYTWSGFGDGVSLESQAPGSTASDFVALKQGFYSISVFLRCANGTVNNRTRVFGYVLVRNSSNTEISRGYLSDTYYRDDANNYDEAIICGSCVKFLNVGDQFRVVTQRTDKESNSGSLNVAQSTSKLYCQYMGIGIAQ